MAEKENIPRKGEQGFEGKEGGEGMRRGGERPEGQDVGEMRKETRETEQIGGQQGSHVSKEKLEEED